MVAIYAALASVIGQLILAKVQSDQVSAANKQKLVDAVNASWTKVQAAHIENQTGAKSGT